MILEYLDKLNMQYEMVNHEAVFTAEEAQKIKGLIKGVGCKNLFLKRDNNKYYLYLLEDNKKGNLKELEKILQIKKLHFATPEELKRILGLDKGGVTPLGIINDKDNLVTVIIDSNLKDKVLLMHPEVNTKTIALKYDDLLKYIKYLKHEYIIFEGELNGQI